jgi:WD40 repeat protein
LRPEVPEELAAFLSKMLAKEPGKRFDRPRDVAQALRGEVPKTVIGRRSSTVLPPAARGRRRLLVAGSAMLVLAALGAALMLRGKGTGGLSSTEIAAEATAQAALKNFVAQANGTKPPDQQQLDRFLAAYPAKETDLRRELVAAWHRHAGTDRALQVGELLMRMRSPLDRLDSKDNDAVAILEQEGPAVRSDRWETLQYRNPFGLAFSPDGKILAVTNTNHTVRLWNLDGPKPQKGRLLSSHTDWVHAVAFSPDGTKIATGSTDKTVRLWDTTTGKELISLPAEGDIQIVAFRGDGKQLASGCNLPWGAEGNGIRLWDLTKEKPPLIQKTTKQIWPCLTFVPGKGEIAAGYYGWIGWFDLAKDPPAELPSFQVPNGSFPHSLAYSPDGKLLWAGLIHGGAFVWDMTAPKPTVLWQQQPPPRSVARGAFAPNGKTVISAYADPAILMTESKATDTKGNPLTQSVPLPPGLGPIHSFALASDGRHVAVGDANRKLHILRLSSPPTR